MVASGCKLLLGTVLVICAASAGATGAVSVPCVPDAPVLGCEPAPPPPSSGPAGPEGEPQPPPQPPPPPDDACKVERSTGTATFTGVVAEQIYGTESNYRGCALSALADAGVRIIRQPLRWSEVERTRGTYDFSFWDRYMASL